MAEQLAEDLHIPVLLNESVEGLALPADGIYVDATLGLGGHAEAVLKAVPGSRVIGIDQDRDAIGFAKERLAKFGDRSTAVHANFEEITRVVNETVGGRVDGVLADLGVSSLQMDSMERGFSFRFDAPLDMRMNAGPGIPTAAELLETLDEEEIANIIYRFGEERFSRRIARRIVESREKGEPVRTTAQLVKIVERSVRKSPKDKIHPATRTFQALRIAVNREIAIIEKFLFDAVELIRPKGRLAVITFHSLEDRAVKQAFQRLAGKCICPPKIPQCVCGARKRVEILTRKPVIPTDEEIAVNPRSRSAKLRIVEVIETPDQ